MNKRKIPKLLWSYERKWLDALSLKEIAFSFFSCFLALFHIFFLSIFFFSTSGLKIGFWNSSQSRSQISVCILPELFWQGLIIWQKFRMALFATIDSAYLIAVHVVFKISYSMWLFVIHCILISLSSYKDFRRNLFRKKLALINFFIYIKHAFGSHMYIFRLW